MTGKSLISLSVVGVLHLLSLAVFAGGDSVSGDLPPYIHQCSRRDPKLHACYVDAIMHVRPWLAKGIPDIKMPSTEPFRLAELSLSLTGGSKGYRITLKDMDVTGVSNFTVRDFSLGSGGVFSLDVVIPELTLVANYSSAGVLIMIPASGRGTLHGALGGVRAFLSGTASVHEASVHEAGVHASTAGTHFLHVDRMNVDLKVHDVQMHIDRAAGENFIIAQATNMLLRNSGHLVLDAMMPELRLKLADVFLGIANNIFSNVPVERLLRD